jgi:hypothetical protein
MEQICSGQLTFKKKLIMHHMTKKSLVAKYAAIAKAGGSAVEVKNAITETEKELTPDEVDDIVLSIFDDVEEEEQQPAATGPAAASTDLPPVDGKKDFSAGKKRYNILRGKWWPTKSVPGLNGNELVVEWEFRPEGKPMKTGVPMEPGKADVFNASKRLRAGRVFTEQMVEVGYTGKILDILPNPFAVREINS